MATTSRSDQRPAAVRVLSVPADNPICIRFLGECKGLDTHWQKGRTIPCSGNGDCPISLHRLGIIWRGYAPAEVWEPAPRLWRSVVLEVTESLEETLRGRMLRGEVWALSRTEERGRSSPVVGIYCETVREANLSETFDILPVLLRLFHVPALHLGTRNPTPPRLMREAVAGDAPRLPADLQPAPSRVQTPEEEAAAKKAWSRFKNSGYRDVPPAPPNGQEHAGNGRKT